MHNDAKLPRDVDVLPPAKSKPAKFRSQSTQRIKAVAFVLDTEYGPTMIGSTLVQRGELITQRRDLPPEYQRLPNAPVVLACVLMEPVQLPVRVEDWEHSDELGIFLPGHFFHGTYRPNAETAMIERIRSSAAPEPVMRAGRAKQLERAKRHDGGKDES